MVKVANNLSNLLTEQANLKLSKIAADDMREKFTDLFSRDYRVHDGLYGAGIGLGLGGLGGYLKEYLSDKEEAEKNYLKSMLLGGGLGGVLGGAAGAGIGQLTGVDRRQAEAARLLESAPGANPIASGLALSLLSSLNKHPGSIKADVQKGVDTLSRMFSR